jgi:hypothetical protein
VERPHSTLELYVMAATIEETVHVGGVVVPEPPTGRLRAAEVAKLQFVEAQQAILSRAGKDALERSPPMRSPLVESLGRLALLHEPDSSTLLIIISDGLQHSALGSWECMPVLPDTAQFVQSVMEQEVLPAHSLQGAYVIFSYMTLTTIDEGRCALELQRALQVRRLWLAVLHAAGAGSVVFLSGPPHLDRLELLIGARDVQRR